MSLKLREALDRADRFKDEIEKADQTTRAQLLGAWKETILENTVKLLQTTEDPETLGFLDVNVACGLSLTESYVLPSKKDSWELAMELEQRQDNNIKKRA